MSIQNIIDNSVSIIVERTVLAASTLSRSGRFRTGRLVGNQPFAFTVQYRPVQTYSTVRDVLEEIDRLDVVSSEIVDIGKTNSGLSWITAYQGDLTATQLGQLSLTSTAAQTITFSTASVVGATATDYVVKKGDYIQLETGYKYPYTATADVQFGSSGSVTIPINRPFIEQAGYTKSGKGLVAGVDVTWTVKMTAKPTYQLLPNRFVEFTGPFTLLEVIED